MTAETVETAIGTVATNASDGALSHRGDAHHLRDGTAAAAAAAEIAGIGIAIEGAMMTGGGTERCKN